MQKEVIKANIIVFIASFCTLVIELVAGRIMAPYVGVSLYTWTSIIGVVLAGISIGAYLGGMLADRFPRPSTLGWLLFFSGVGAFSISPLTNLLGATQFQTSLMMRILLLTTFIFFIPSCILGMISPVVVKLTLHNLAKTGNIVGKIYAFSTLGSIIGTFATGFFLISWMGTRNILLIIGFILILSALIFGGAFVKKKSIAILFSAFIIIFVSLVFIFYSYAFKMPVSDKTYFFKESDYYTIQVKKILTKDKETWAEALVLDHLIHSINDLNNPLYLDYEYIRIYEEFMRWRVKRAGSLKTLFIGGGGYTLPRCLEIMYPMAEIDVVEIDPEITKVVYNYLGVPASTKIRTFNEDGRWFVMNCRDKEKYDFIVVDAFNDLSIPYHLTTKEFAQQMAELLKPDGILMANVIDSYQKGLFMPSYIKTLEEVFGRGNVHLVTHKPYEESTGISTRVIVASKQGIKVNDFVDFIHGQGGKEAMSHVMPQDRLQAYMAERPSTVLKDDYVPVDNLTAPIFEERFGYQRR
ncbi:MAG TPA: fused MFS/spermidine synthase [Syntrophales bacterium]|nr:fused MFS/spermidine synthase [Syntrophales bacterium]